MLNTSCTGVFWKNRNMYLCIKSSFIRKWCQFFQFTWLKDIILLYYQAITHLKCQTEYLPFNNKLHIYILVKKIDKWSSWQFQSRGLMARDELHSVMIETYQGNLTHCDTHLKQKTNSLIPIHKWGLIAIQFYGTDCKQNTSSLIPIQKWGLIAIQFYGTDCKQNTSSLIHDHKGWLIANRIQVHSYLSTCV